MCLYVNIVLLLNGTARDVLLKMALSKMRTVTTSIPDVVTTSLYDVAKTLPKRYYNQNGATTLAIGCLCNYGYNSQFFLTIRT